MREFKSATGFNWTGKAVLPGSLSILCVFVCVHATTDDYWLLVQVDLQTGFCSKSW